ncbi:MAG TPA: L-rhamnose/proton symporter RhaT [Chitinophagaceae bacterium]|jgi:L-rhamnose-H+ transport protein|nr:L-rhamnose/proton symporter RhaT [Chitinophagaceae bacterium]
MQAIFGVLFHFIGGFASGSFYVPYKKVRNWAWETYWIIGGLFSWLIIPPLAAWLTVPGFAEIIRQTDAATLGWTYFWGVMWGIGGLTYGLGIRYLGMSLGNSVLLGLTAAFGSLIPSIYYNLAPQEGKVTFTDLLSSAGGRLVLLGVLVCLTGIAICGIAGRRKEKAAAPGQQQQSVKEFNLRKGLTLAIISGILSACFNYGIEAGEPMADIAVARGFDPLFQNNVTYVVLLWGGLTTNLLWCLLLNARNRTFGDYTNSRSPLTTNYFFSALAGTTWYLQFFFYGMGESKLGNGASSWILHMAFIILVSNMWGLFLKEWKGVPRPILNLFFLGLATIIASVVLVGIGNTLGH